MESGHLRKLDHIGEEVPVLELFTNIWGAGAKTAHLWYQQVKHLSICCLIWLLPDCFIVNIILGSSSVFIKVLFLQGFRTLEDIRTKAQLSATQRIGLKHYDDFLDRMPRDEAAAIEAVVISFFKFIYLFIFFTDFLFRVSVRKQLYYLHFFMMS